MSGAGNCFLVADAQGLRQDLRPDSIQGIIVNNPRKDGKTIEGVLLLRSMRSDHIFADFNNPDGSHGMMCGNGSRCIVRFALDNGLEASG
ncbi:MAG: diaminopimelate epimerase, partial [Bacteroidota bacterium]